MRAYDSEKRLLDAVAYFDHLTASGQMAGMGALAMVHTADRFSIPQEELRAAICAVRHNEKHNAKGGAA